MFNILLFNPLTPDVETGLKQNNTVCWLKGRSRYRGFGYRFNAFVYRRVEHPSEFHNTFMLGIRRRLSPPTNCFEWLM
jgi:hypothetical protein